MRIVAALATAALLQACAQPAADSAPFAVARSNDGATVSLHREAGPCSGQARMAVHRAADGTRTVGCWLLAPDVVVLVWLDGDSGRIPAAHLQRVSDR